MENTLNQQRSRILRVATLAAGTFVHLVLCCTVLSIGDMSLQPIEFAALASLAMAGYLFFALLIYFEWNLTFDYPDLSLPQMIWAVTMVVLATHFTVELKPAVLLAGLALVVMGTNRLNQRQQIIFASYGLALYLVSLYFQSEAKPLHWLVELVVLICFSLVLVVGPVLYRFETGVIESALLNKNRELIAALDQIRELAIRDELTGAYNRRHVTELLAQQKALADRANYTFSLCFVDLDFFKRVNDRFGHTVGDQVLKDFAKLAEQVLREVDCVARMGGEEFLLVLAGTTQHDAFLAAQRLAAGLIDIEVSNNEPGYRITASMGVTEYRKGETVQAVIERADKALYEAKRTGRNKVLIAESANEFASAYKRAAVQPLQGTQS